MTMRETKPAVNVAGKIYQTKNYSIFKCIIGNRIVEEARVQKIIRSIKKVGYIAEPIIVNEKMEVIDGQGRLEACKRLGLPVYYTVVEGLAFEHVIESNNSRTGWTSKDYVHAFSERGSNDYKYLEQLLAAYSGQLSITAVFAAAVPDNSTSVKSETVRGGGYTCTPAQYDKAVKMAEYFLKAKPFVSKLEGRKDRVYMALKFMKNHKNVDADLLLKKMEKGWVTDAPIETVRQAVGELQKLYNYRNRAKCYVLSDYDREAERQGE